jgi:hypothetical protein
MPHLHQRLSRSLQRQRRGGERRGFGTRLCSTGDDRDTGEGFCRIEVVGTGQEQDVQKDLCTRPGKRRKTEDAGETYAGVNRRRRRSLSLPVSGSEGARNKKSGRKFMKLGLGGGSAPFLVTPRVRIIYRWALDVFFWAKIYKITTDILLSVGRKKSEVERTLNDTNTKIVLKQ